MKEYKNSNLFHDSHGPGGGSGPGSHGPGYGGGGSNSGFQGNQGNHNNQGGYNQQNNQDVNSSSLVIRATQSC